MMDLLSSGEEGTLTAHLSHFSLSRYVAAPGLYPGEPPDNPVRTSKISSIGGSDMHLHDWHALAEELIDRQEATRVVHRYFNETTGEEGTWEYSS